ncbi:DUF2938 domain-containing protein [Ahrensia marina]|uniref:DUF2938 domain-containing protein n=1 Tax=Ahrensia marina TaxID=1514904 RepID=UPI0035D1357E
MPMDWEAEFVFRAILIGVGATATMDIWAVVMKRAFGVPSLNYGFVGRWLGHMRHGQFAHESIAEAPPIAGEQIIGWSAHYVIGVIFAGLFLFVLGVDWARDPTLLPAVLFGIVTVSAPFFVMQPGMGLGFAAAKAPKSNIARLRSLIAHTSFGFGLFLATWSAAQVFQI